MWYNNNNNYIKKEEYMKKKWELFISFFKIGAFTIGGGYAMIPLMQREIVEKKRWLKHDEVLDMVVISESTPGVLSVNFATYVGYKVAGIWGSIIATISVVIPSFIIILLISLFLDAFSSNQLIQYFLKGIKAGVVILLLSAVIKLLKINKFSYFNIAMMILTLIIVFTLKVSVFYLLIGGAIVGIIYGAFSFKGKMING